MSGSWGKLDRAWLEQILGYLDQKELTTHTGAIHAQVCRAWTNAKVAWKYLNCPSLVVLRHVAQPSALRTIILGMNVCPEMCALVERLPNLEDVQCRWTPDLDAWIKSAQFTSEAARVRILLQLHRFPRDELFLERDFQPGRFGGGFFQDVRLGADVDVLRHFETHPEATFLSLQRARIDGVPAGLVQNLQHVRFSHCKSAPRFKAKRFFAGIKQLQVLELHDNENILTNRVLKCAFPSLRRLELSKCNLSLDDLGCPNLEEFVGIECLQVAVSQKLIQVWPRLWSLHLTKCGFGIEELTDWSQSALRRVELVETPANLRVHAHCVFVKS